MTPFTPEPDDNETATFGPEPGNSEPAPLGPIESADFGPPPPIFAHELLDTLLADCKRRKEAKDAGLPLGPVTGFAALDAELGGCLEPGLHQLHAAPGAGKTAFALSVAAACGCPALYVTCEMAPLELMRRMMARLTGTFLGTVKQGGGSVYAGETFAEHAARKVPKIAHIRMIDATARPVPLAEIEEAAAAQKAESDRGHALIVLDSFHAWAMSGALPPAGRGGEYEALSAAVEALRSLAVRLGVPILLIAERSRSGMDGGMHSGAGTRRLEYAAETVIELTPKDDRDAVPASKREVTVRLSKNRHGTPNRPISMTFEGAKQEYEEKKNGGGQ